MSLPRGVMLMLGLAAVACAGKAVGASGLALSAGPGLAATAKVSFSIRVPPILRLRTLQSAASVEVPPAQGHAPLVDLHDAATLEVQTNVRADYELRFEITDPEVESVEIVGLQQPVTVSRSGTTLRMRPATTGDRVRLHALRYVIRYAQGARPGLRPIPVAYSLSSGA